MRATFFEKLYNIMEKNEDVILLTGDLGFSLLEKIEKNFENRFYNVGVSEQALISIAAGLAKEGKKPVVYSILSFLLYRPYEQILFDVCYHDLPVTLVSSGPGFSYGEEGVTHYGLLDLSLLLPIENVSVYSPAEASEAANYLEEAINSNKPTYIRLSKAKNPSFKAKIKSFDGITVLSESSKENVIVSTSDISLVVEEAVQLLKSEGIFFSHLHVGRIKPLSDYVKKFTENAKLIITVEEHNSTLGFGSFIADQLNKQVVKIGVKNIFHKDIGKRDYMLRKNNLDSKAIYTFIKSLVTKK